MSAEHGVAEHRDVRVSIDASAVPDDPAGAGRYVLDLVTALGRRQDTRLTIVCREGDERRWRRAAITPPTGPTSADENGTHRTATVARPRPLVLGLVPNRRPVRLAWEQLRLPGLLAALPLDVHHSPHYTMPERARVPKVVTIHDLSFFEHPAWHERAKVALFRRAIRVAARKAEALVAVSQATADKLAALVAPAAPVHVIPHGVDTARYHPLTTDAETATLPVRPPYVLFVGTIEPRKDVPTLVRAFDRLAGAHADLSLVLAGATGWGTDPVDAAIAAATHGGRVRRLGYVTEDTKAALLRNAAAVAYPSLDEGFGLPALEALASGAPLITTEGSVMDALADGAAATFGAKDATALAHTIEAALAPTADLEARRRKGLDVAAAHTWDASAAAHVAVYRSVARS